MHRKAWVIPMKNRKSLLITGVIMIPIAVVICILSVRMAKEYGGTHIIFGGRAELRNTIELSSSEIDNLEVLYSSKNIVVYPSKDDSIIIKEYLVSDRADALAKVDTTYNEATGESTTVVTGGSAAITIFGFFAGGERIEVYLPENGLDSLLIKTGSGNIYAESGFSMETKRFEARAGSGNIVWHDTSAEKIYIRAGSGNIKLTHAEGNAELSTGSGNINVKEFSGQGIVKAGSGNIILEVREIKGDLSIKTGSGNSRLTLPAQLSFRFEAKTGSGYINTSFDEKLTYNKKGNQAQGEIGDDPSALVSVEANSGNVNITAE